jgi:protein involved in sex pheromone biosynthesis
MMKRYLIFIAVMTIVFLGFSCADKGGNLVGKWYVEWEGGMASYTGFLYINKKISKNAYSGTLDLTYGEGKNIKQDAVITLKTPDTVIVNCMNPSQQGWNPDNFYLTLKENIMFGNSRDAKGVAGKKVYLKKVN